MPEPKRHLPILRLATVLMVVLAGVAGSIFAFFYTRDHERSLAQATFEREAVNVAASLSKDISRYEDLLLSIRRLFDSSVEVNRNAFHIFCAGPIKRLPGIQALEWVPRVPRAERIHYERTAHAEGFPGFQFTERDAQGRLIPAPERQEYFPVFYVEPYAGNESALGHTPQLSARLDAIDKARDSGMGVATGRFTLIQEKEAQAGTAYFLPIYHGGVPETVEARRAELIGFAEGVFRIGDMVKASLQGMSVDAIGISLVDRTDPENPEPLYSHGPPSEPNPAIRYLTAIDFGGRQWSLLLYPTAPHNKAAYPLEWLVLWGGLFITALTGAYLLAETTRNEKIARTVDERTAELRLTIEESARHQAELAQAKELDRLKTNFVGVVSHDLRTPLTSIIGYAEFLEDGIGGELSDAQRTFVQQILKSAQRLEILVNDLLDFARLDAGTFKLTLQTVELRDRLQGIVESLRPQIESAQLALELEDPEEPLLARMDIQRIDRVLINFLSNAIKFTPPGGTIRLSARREARAIRCEVRDTGEGIAEEDLPKLFQRFSQLKSGEKRGGTGLGLSICKAIIEAHGGEVGVRSVAGEGSTFWFTLPSA